MFSQRRNDCTFSIVAMNIMASVIKCSRVTNINKKAILTGSVNSCKQKIKRATELIFFLPSNSSLPKGTLMFLYISIKESSPHQPKEFNCLKERRVNTVCSRCFDLQLSPFVISINRFYSRVVMRQLKSAHVSVKSFPCFRSSSLGFFFFFFAQLSILSRTCENK